MVWPISERHLGQPKLPISARSNLRRLVPPQDTRLVLPHTGSVLAAMAAIIELYRFDVQAVN